MTLYGVTFSAAHDPSAANLKSWFSDPLPVAQCYLTDPECWSSIHDPLMMHAFTSGVAGGLGKPQYASASTSGVMVCWKFNDPNHIIHNDTSPSGRTAEDIVKAFYADMVSYINANVVAGVYPTIFPVFFQECNRFSGFTAAEYTAAVNQIITWANAVSGVATAIGAGRIKHVVKLSAGKAQTSTGGSGSAASSAAWQWFIKNPGGSYVSGLYCLGFDTYHNGGETAPYNGAGEYGSGYSPTGAWGSLNHIINTILPSGDFVGSGLEWGITEFGSTGAPQPCSGSPGPSVDGGWDISGFYSGPKWYQTVTNFLSGVTPQPAIVCLYCSNSIGPGTGEIQCGTNSYGPSWGFDVFNASGAGSGSVASVRTEWGTIMGTGPGPPPVPGAPDAPSVVTPADGSTEDLNTAAFPITFFYEPNPGSGALSSWSLARENVSTGGLFEYWDATGVAWGAPGGAAVFNSVSFLSLNLDDSYTYIFPAGNWAFGVWTWSLDTKEATSGLAGPASTQIVTSGAPAPPSPLAVPGLDWYRIVATDRNFNTLGILPATNLSFGSMLNGAGSISFDIEPPFYNWQGDRVPPSPSQLNAWTKKGQTFLWIQRNEVLVWGGILWNRTRNQAMPGQPTRWSISGLEFLSYGTKRLIVNDYTSPVDYAVLLERVWNDAQGVTNGSIGLTISAAACGTTFTPTYQQSNHVTLDQVMRDGTATQLYEVRSQVFYTAGTYGSLMRIGSPICGRPFTSTNLTIDTSWCAPPGYSWPEDGSNMGNRIYELGSLPNRSTQVLAISSDGGAAGRGDPLMEQVISRTFVGSTDLLQSAAEADLDLYANGTLAPTVPVYSHHYPELGSYELGDEVRITGEPDDNFPGGIDTMMRIVAWSTAVPDQAGRAITTLTLGRVPDFVGW